MPVCEKYFRKKLVGLCILRIIKSQKSELYLMSLALFCEYTYSDPASFAMDTGSESLSMDPVNLRGMVNELHVKTKN